jgi:hypothetical protein
MTKYPKSMGYQEEVNQVLSLLDNPDKCLKEVTDGGRGS